MIRLFCTAILLSTVFAASAQWRVLSPSDQRQTQPPKSFSEGTAIKLGDACPEDQKFRWLVAELEIPATINNEPTAGKVVGLQINCGDGGEVYVNDVLQGRFDNDHPALAVLSESAVPGAKVRVAIQVYAHVQGGDKFDQANWVIIESKRAKEPLVLSLDASHPTGKVPEGIVGLSQGGGMSDYDEATARKLKEGGFKWFRMDNVFTGVLKAGQGTNLVYDWTDFDRRVDFIRSIEADPILAVSYMPQVLDAVPNNERQSAPKDYAAWCANSITRAFLPAQIDRPCFFYVKQNDMNFRGDYSLLMKDNLPKASYNVAKIFNGLRGNWLTVTGTDDDVSAVAAWDAQQSRLAIVLVNFRDRYALRRPVQLRLNHLPSALSGGKWLESVVDATHSNAWNDPAKPELTVTRSGEGIGQAFAWEKTLPPNSVMLIELNKR